MGKFYCRIWGRVEERVFPDVRPSRNHVSFRHFSLLSGVYARKPSCEYDMQQVNCQKYSSA
jgi:hypothetical protein